MYDGKEVEISGFGRKKVQKTVFFAEKSKNQLAKFQNGDILYPCCA